MKTEFFEPKFLKPKLKIISSGYQQPQNDILHKFDKKIKHRTEGQENEAFKKDNDVQID
jgi:hypothetical protein